MSKAERKKEKKMERKNNTSRGIRKRGGIKKSNWKTRNYR